MALSPNDAYQELVERWGEITIFGSFDSLLGWDEQTTMPPKGTAHRGEQRAALAGLLHDRVTDPKIGDLLESASDDSLISDATSVEAVNIREIRRTYERVMKMPRDLVEELARVTSLSQAAWKEAREEKNFAKFLPWFEQVAQLKHREAEALAIGPTPYDSLLDDYEPGATIGSLMPILGSLRDELVPLVKAITESGRRPESAFLRNHYSEQGQEQFGKAVAAAIGFDFDAGRLDETTHPFCSGIGPGDTRITTRYDENFLPQSLFGIMHEAGHALYDQGLDREHYGTPMGGSSSLGIHESQSRMWENFVGRSRSFWEHALPKAKNMFPEALDGVELDDIYAAVNDVQPSFIRVEADEATYNLHILLRFEMEQAIINDNLAPFDVPDAWNEKFKSYFGLTPTDDSVGCLQDIHWSGGMIGYFPTYTLGNLCAAQFFEQARLDVGDLDAQFAKGEFEPLRSWLTEKIHRQGRRYRGEELVEVVTGSPLSHRPLVDHLKKKFEPLYGI